MGMVLQDPFLFNGSVKDNILFGRLNASDEEVIAAAQAVGAHDFIISLKNGYDTSWKKAVFCSAWDRDS